MNRTLKFSITGLVVVFVLALFFWFYSHSRIVISNPDNNSTSYVITNQANGKSFTINGGNNVVSRTVSRGSYVISADDSKRTFVSAVSTKPFLQKSTVLVKLHSQASRTFVGNNPAACMNYINGVLVSYTCDGSYASLVVHHPATPTKPTWTTSPINGFLKDIEGITLTSQGYSMVLRNLDDLGTDFSHYAYPITDASQTLDAATSTAGATGLAGLNSNTNYLVSTYQKGLLLHDKKYSSIIQFSPGSGQGRAVPIAQAPKNATIPVRFDNTDDTVAVFYTNIPSDTDGQKSNLKIVGKLIIFKNGQNTTYSFNQSVYGLQLCGQQKVCIVTDAGMTVYALGKKSLSPLFTIPHVNTILRAPGGILAQTDKNILFINPDDATGYVAYSFGSYQFNAMATDPAGGLISVTNGGGNKVALLLNLSQPNTDNIDGKIAALGRSSNISNISIYKNLVFISPNYGEVVWVPSQSQFGYDPAKKATVDAAIAKDVANSGINTSQYQIINAYTNR